MSGVALRVGLAVLALLVGVVVCAEALVFASAAGVAFADLLLPTFALGSLALAAAGFSFAHTRALVAELSALAGALRAPGARPSLLPHARFRESDRLRAELSALLAEAQRVQAACDDEHAKTDAPLALRIRFVAAMGHELRTPLNALLGFSDLLALDRNATWNPAQTQSLRVLCESARDLLGLIDDMIDWARLESGELAFTRVATPVQVLLQRAAELAKRRSGARGLRVRMELGPDLGAALVDPDRAVQALVGLMDHAARSDGAPELLVRATQTEAFRPDAAPAAAATSGGSASHASGALRIEVTDAQLELREADHEQLFRPFRPSFAPSGRRLAGLSLGTALARTLLRAQGGDVWFEGRPERGTTFVVALPGATEPPRAKS